MVSTKANSISQSPGARPGVSLVVNPVVDLYEGGYNHPVYEAKARVLNHAIQDIGMGRYQWCLFVVAGFGWFADVAWPILSSLILTPVVSEFHFKGPFLLLASNIGLFVGAVFWSLGCDIWGRRWPFNITLFVPGIFGLAAGASPSFVALASLFAVVSFGSAGTLPVDSAIFLDFVPASHQYLLTTLSTWWSVGQLIPSLVAWPLITNYSCATASDCTKSSNMGWRYLLFILGGITLLLGAFRIFSFSLLESPRFLSGVGRDADAVRVIHQMAKFNGKVSSLTVEELEAPDRAVEGGHSSYMEKHTILSKNSHYNAEHIKALFATPKMAWSTSILIAIWGILGLASTLYNNFLPYLLFSRGAVFGDGSLYITYRNQVILSIVCVPAGFLASWAVELPYIGRKGTKILSNADHPQNTALTGALLLATTTARTSNNLLAWNCGYVFFNNTLYGVLTSMSVEVFPAKDRGTGIGLLIMATRLFGILGPVIALYANLATTVPVYIAGALIIFAGGLALLLPYEPRGKASI
ncbi:MFS general substrate transporter [Rhizopogon vinicolor AM-OR11-026]|uniref:MFS general substrate transporter n=1 Tax=Rhizopogon vinicolor AM-OR11-026 TaxID=1314800 RepID=A0A1B7MKS2_9AGAM|nr:MFS general substrate transporter [Rhizopogon vinicolor AM-OR11-026]